MTARVPMRLQALINLTALLKTITPTNGYNNDLSDIVDVNGDTRTRVVRGRNTFGSNDPLPMVSILEYPHTEPAMQQSPEYSALNVGPWILLIQGFVEDDPINPTDPAHILEADVKMCLGTALKATHFDFAGLLGMGSAIRSYKIGTGVVRPGDDVSAYANFWLTLTMEVSEDMSNPFAPN